MIDMTDKTPNPDDAAFEEAFEASKTARKREMHALQAVAIALTELNNDQLAKIPLDAVLSKAVHETRNIKKHEALRRHHQYLGRLLREGDHQAISAAVENLKSRGDRLARLQPLVLQWRDDLIEGDNTTLTRFVDTFPQTERQRLRQLVSNAKKHHIPDAPQSPKNSPDARKLLALIKQSVIQHLDEQEKNLL